MKKIISITLAVLMIAFCFSACSGNNEKNKPATENTDIKFTYDSIYADYDDSVKRAYNDLSLAVVNHEDSIRVNISMLDKILQLFYTSSPFRYLTNSIEYNEDMSGVKISYKFDEEEHKGLIDSFNSKITEIEKECGFGKVNNSVYVLNVYNFISSNMKISNNSSITLFETVVNSEGSIFSYANLFEYLLLQKNIMAFHVIAEDSIGNGWALSSAQINNEIYYFDMATEFYTNGGTGINYFAMNSDDLKDEGLKNIQYTSNTKIYETPYNDFKACRSAKTWSLEGNNLKIVQHNGNDFTIELK